MTASAWQTTPCTDAPHIFQHPLLEESCSGLKPAQRSQQTMLRHSAEHKCLGCPMLVRCLYAAIIEYDVAGYVAATTPRQRTQIRALLGVEVPPENLDALVGIVAPKHKISQDDVLRMRNRHPNESLEGIAFRLGCSLSSVKRHLRKAREDEARLRVVKPSLRHVIEAWLAVTDRGPQGQRGATRHAQRADVDAQAA